MMKNFNKKILFKKHEKIFFEGIEIAYSNAKFNFEKNHNIKYNDF